jgi:hypothetical protein
LHVPAFDMTDPLPSAGRPALRVIHLTGGQRAFDLGEPKIRIGPDLNRPFLTIPDQPYAEAYRALASIGLAPIGVDFITGPPRLREQAPADFQTLAEDHHCTALWCERAWSDVRNVPSQRDAITLSISARFTTYHRLLTLRIRDLSEAYRRCLLARLTDIDGQYSHPVPGSLFSNGFQTLIEAGIHAWLADAAGMRDLIAEAIWRLVLRESSDQVTTLTAFLRRTKGRDDDSGLIADLQAAGAADAWLKVLSDLRNGIIHAAPLANTHELHMTQCREQPLQGGSMPALHYPLTAAGGLLRPRPDPIDFEDEAALEGRLREYRAFVDASGDALTYACATTTRLVVLANRVREAAGLSHRIRQITSADIIGPVRFAAPPPETD